MLVRIFWITSLLFLMVPPFVADAVNATDSIRTKVLLLSGFVFLSTNAILQVRMVWDLAQVRGFLIALASIAGSFALTYLSLRISALGFFVWLAVLINAFRLQKDNGGVRNRNYAGK